jgi:hypothetical protein
MARQYDDFGNYTDNDGQFWVGADGTHDGAYFYDGSWHISPPSSDGGGITYETYTSDGSDGFRPGTILQRGSNGSVTVKYTPPAGSSGGGGSTTINYNTQAANDLGPNRYAFRTSDGTDGMPPGTTYQIDLLDGSLSNIKFPAAPTANVNPADRNNDGLDDSTNLALGVFPSSKSPTGYIYSDGTIVTPNGAPTGQGNVYSQDTGGGAPQLVNGKYIWDGTKFVIAPGMESTTSAGSSGTRLPARG